MSYTVLIHVCSYRITDVRFMCLAFDYYLTVCKPIYSKLDVIILDYI